MKTIPVDTSVRLGYKSGIYTVISCQAGDYDCSYALCPKSQWEKWNGDDPDTYHKDVFNDVDHKDVELLFK